MRRGAVALIGCVQLAGIGLRLLDQLLDAGDAELVADADHVGRGGEDRDRLELRRIEVEFGIEILVHRERRRRRGHERVAIGLGLRHMFSADISACARAVIDDDRLLPHRPENLGDDAWQHVRRSTRRKRHHNANRLVRPRALRKRIKRTNKWRARGGAKTHDDCASVHLPLQNAHVWARDLFSVHTHTSCTTEPAFVRPCARYCPIFSIMGASVMV